MSVGQKKPRIALAKSLLTPAEIVHLGRTILFRYL